MSATSEPEDAGRDGRIPRLLPRMKPAALLAAVIALSALTVAAAPPKVISVYDGHAAIAAASEM
jgi:hypothetical protein